MKKIITKTITILLIVILTIVLTFILAICTYRVRFDFTTLNKLNKELEAINIDINYNNKVKIAQEMSKRQGFILNFVL